MNFSIDINNIEASFTQIASELMNNSAIRVKSTYYRIVEIEFYLNDKAHVDAYTHGHAEQLKNGSWYFHGSGIDITIGNQKQNTFGGVLVRGIAKLSTTKNANGDCIEVAKNTMGPLNVLTTLFSHFIEVYDRDNSFYLIKKENVTGFQFENATILQCPRVGLNSTVDKHFYDKPYRFITYPYLAHKDKEKIQSYLINTGTITDINKIKELFTLKYGK